MLSASANKLSKLKEQAAEYASLIMEELDPENLGYIEVTIKSLTPFIKKSIKFSIFKLEGMLPAKKEIQIPATHHWIVSN